MKIGLEDRLEHDLRGGHDHPIADRGDTERPDLARFARLGNMHSPQWLRPIRPRPKLFGEAVEESSY
jgi:hypothetical protein